MEVLSNDVTSFARALRDMRLELIAFGERGAAVKLAAKLIHQERYCSWMFA